MPKIFKFRSTIITNKPSQPSQKQPQMQILHILKKLNAIYVKTAPLTHDLYESKSHQKVILIKKSNWEIR